MLPVCRVYEVPPASRHEADELRHGAGAFARNGAFRALHPASVGEQRCVARAADGRRRCVGLARGENVKYCGPAGGERLARKVFPGKTPRAPPQRPAHFGVRINTCDLFKQRFGRHRDVVDAIDEVRVVPLDGIVLPDENHSAVAYMSISCKLANLAVSNGTLAATPEKLQVSRIAASRGARQVQKVAVPREVRSGHDRRNALANKSVCLGWCTRGGGQRGRALVDRRKAVDGGKTNVEATCGARSTLRADLASDCAAQCRQDQALPLNRSAQLRRARTNHERARDGRESPKVVCVLLRATLQCAHPTSLAR